MKSDRNTVNMCSVRRWTIRAIGFGFGIVALAAMTFGGAGCPSSRTDTIDLVAVDRGFDDDKALGDEQVLLYFDVLEGGRFQEPDVVLTGSGSGLIGLQKALFEGDHLFVFSNQSTVSIFRDYRSLTNDAAPSVELDLSPEEATDMVIANNRLFVAFHTQISCCPDRRNSISIWNKADEITESRPPDLVLVENPLPVGGRFSIMVDGDILAVKSDLTAGVGNTIDLFRILDTDDDKGLDYELLVQLFPPFEDGERISLIGFFDNTLYVNVRSRLLYTYENASSLMSGAQPSAILPSSSSNSNWDYIVGIGDYLFTSGRERRYSITVFDGREPLRSGQAPLGGLSAESEEIRQPVVAGDALFGITQSGSNPSIHVFRNARKILHGQQEEDFLLPSYLDFAHLVYIDAQKVGD